MEKRQSTSPSPTFGYNNQFGLYENHAPNAPHHRKTGLYVRLLSERAFTFGQGAAIGRSNLVRLGRWEVAEDSHLAVRRAPSPHRRLHALRKDLSQMGGRLVAASRGDLGERQRSRLQKPFCLPQAQGRDLLENRPARRRLELELRVASRSLHLHEDVACPEPSAGFAENEVARVPQGGRVSDKAP